MEITSIIILLIYKLVLCKILLIINFTKPLKKETLLFKGKLTNVCGLGGPLKAHSKQSLFFF